MQKQVCATLVIETLMDTGGERGGGKVCLETVVDVNIIMGKGRKGDKGGEPIALCGVENFNRCFRIVVATVVALLSTVIFIRQRFDPSRGFSSFSSLVAASILSSFYFAFLLSFCSSTINGYLRIRVFRV